MFENIEQEDLDIISDALDLFYSKICYRLEKETECGFSIYNKTKHDTKQRMFNMLSKLKDRTFKLKLNINIELEKRQSLDEGDWTTM